MLETQRTPGPHTPSETAQADSLGGTSRNPINVGWLEERLQLSALQNKYGRKAFPVHSTFFLGEMAAISFLILVLTGVYLGLIYTPSNADITVAGQKLPEALASVQLIESIPVANLIRNVHHWAAHVMIVTLVLHAVRVYFTGTYRKPRELTWVLGVVLLGLTLAAGFVGYALPWDAFAVTATGIGYGLARSIPLVGHLLGELFFGGAFPSLGSLPRLYTIHVVVIPASIVGVLSLHLLLVLKQKHSMPGYARKVAEPGRVLGISVWPYHALLAGQLVLLMLGALSLLAAFVPVHPLAAYGPPTAETLAVKPDWYLLWIFGFLKLIPAGVGFSVGPITITPEFLGGVLFPGTLFGVMTLVPWLDRTNRHVVRRFEYLEPPSQALLRLTLGVGALTFIGMLLFAAYYDQIGLTLGEIWLLVLCVPVLLGGAIFGWSRFWRGRRAALAGFDPTSGD
ncbi:MAG TPA: cytochrome b N-terminal domain-containing protein [Chloroflexota bacterium]|nr:cytochrome b N-terminal domain-containing protein [Chloroflexota bacterium]